MADTGIKDKAKGEYNKAVGYVKEEVGEATGNKELEVKGATQRAEGHVEEGIGKVKKEFNK